MHPNIATQLSFLTLTLAFPGLIQADAGDQPETSYDCSTHSEPYQLSYGMATVNAAIDAPTDVDVAEFYGEAGDSIRIRLLTLNVDVDPLVSLYYSPSLQLVAQDSASSNQYNLCSLVLDESDFVSGTTLPMTGVYRIVIEDQGVNNAGQYTFQLERVPPHFPMRTLPYNTPTRDELQTWTDTDYFSFCATAGSLLRLSFLTLNVDIDPRVEIRAPDGSLVDLPGCDSNQYNVCSFTRDFVPPQTGRYMLVVYDSGVNNPGRYELSVNCILGCPQLAGSVQRNGSGTNPLVYDTTCPPVIGGVWASEIDCSGHPGAFTTLIFAYLSPLGGVSSPFGELLVDTSSPRVCHPLAAPVDADSISRRAVAVPCDVGLAGLQLYTQGMVVGGPSGPRFTNAVDLGIGY